MLCTVSNLYLSNFGRHFVTFSSTNIKLLEIQSLTKFTFIQEFFSQSNNFTLQNHAYSNIQKISPLKTENLQIKKLIFFIFLLKT